MKRTFQYQGFEFCSNDDLGCDLFIFAVGYESRSIFIASKIGLEVPNRVGLGFRSRQTESFVSNRRWVEDSGATFLDLTLTEFNHWTEGPLTDLVSGARIIAVDVSSFSRDRLATLLMKCWRFLEDKEIEELRILYAPGKFDVQHLPEAYTQVASAELLFNFEGDWVDTERSLTAIIGLGYEPGRALGAFELLEPENTVLFLPDSIDSRYDHFVRTYNAPLTASGSKMVELSYDVMDSPDLLDRMLRIIDGAAVHGRSVLVPLGPKIFAAISCIASLLSSPQVPIWRISGGESEPAYDVQAEGHYCVLSLRRHEVDK